MTQPRSTLISLADTPYYHCASRCVRQAFLCGKDRKSGESYEHRREWLEQKLLNTAESFAIKVCAYAVMSNHYHVVLRVCPEQANEWSSKEVIVRWHSLYSGTVFSRRYMDGEVLPLAEQDELNKSLALWRDRLMSISWFMKIVNHAVAVMANEEDQCKGHFWESRFKSQALLDDRALLACMAYVDLNPIRAKLASTPEQSTFTSIKSRIDSIAKQTEPVRCLDQFTGINKKTNGIPFRLDDYIQLVEWSGRIVHLTKKGFITTDEPGLLKRLSLDKDAWHTLITQFEQHFGHWVGSEHIVRQIVPHDATQFYWANCYSLIDAIERYSLNCKQGVSDEKARKTVENIVQNEQIKPHLNEWFGNIVSFPQSFVDQNRAALHAVALIDDELEERL